MGYVLLGLILLGIPYIVPIAAWVSARRTRRRIEALEQLVGQQKAEIGTLVQRVQLLGRPAATAAPDLGAVVVRETARPAADVATPSPAVSAEAKSSVEPAAPAAPAPATPAAEAPPVVPLAAQPAAVSPPPPAATPAPTAAPPAPPIAPSPAVTPPLAPAVETPPVPAVPKPVVPSPVPALREGAAPARDYSGPRSTPVPPTGPRPPQPPQSPPPPPPSEPAFDWESLVGVKLFSAIAGIALVLAAVFFLRYSIEHGWLQPPVRVLIGIATAVALLVLCELKAARRYPVTANALDAAAIAILFATFFAAHALWNLIPAFVTFVLLGVVTALAVLLSIRRESMFIAVLGLLGGFATPALLSSGENRPIPLFAYLMLLNIGLAWVAYRQTWPVLTWLTLLLTTVYQWGWVFRFLHESSLSLAMGVFLAFPLATVTGLLFARRSVQGASLSAADRSFERTALLSSALPLLFAIYLAVVPAYGVHASLLFGFLLLLDAGLLAVTLARGQDLLHAGGALATVLVMAVWLATSYAASARFAAVGFTAAFVTLYLLAPAVARRFGRTLGGLADQARFAAPVLLFVFTALAAIEPAFAAPRALFGVLFALMALIVWRAVTIGDGPLYYVAAFFAVAAQASWSATHLTPERLGTAVAVYAAFGGLSIGTPLLARRYYSPLEPPWGGGVVLLVSLGLLLFLSLGPVSPAALWAMALLLAILNAGLFVESASGGLPLLSQAGSLFSWLILALWWGRAAGSVGVVPSLTVLTGLALITLAGHVWAHAYMHRTADAVSDATFARGRYLVLAGHLFFVFLALNREWAFPPWPLFGALTVVTLAISTAALATGAWSLHAAGTIAAAVVMAMWAGSAGAPPWGIVAVIASAAVSLYALAWIPLAHGPEGSGAAALAAVFSLFIGEFAVILANGAGAKPGFAAVAIAHCANVAAILWLASWRRWRHAAVAAVVVAWLALLQWYTGASPASHWGQLLVLATALYAIFIAYPFVVGPRAREDRDPYLAAVLASAMYFFSARNAFEAGGLGWAVGVIPVAEAAILALLLRRLLTLESKGERDMTRLALVAGAALAFVTVAIPLQLRHQWITIGWALEGAALAWLYRRVPHRGLLYFGNALLLTVFVRLAMNPEILVYEPRGALRIFNWYLYTYLICAAAFFAAGWWLSTTEDRIGNAVRSSQLLPGAAVILLFLLLNIEIADYYATGPTIAFRFGVTVSQDLTYTIGWLVFGMLLLAAGIYLINRPARVTAVTLIAVTTFKCFLYDLGSLAGLYRVASFVGLAFSLALVSLALQKYVLSKSERTS